MGHDDFVAGERQLLDFGDYRRELNTIGVADYCFDRCNRLELGEYTGRTHIAGVQYEVDPLEPGEDIRTQLSVRIADQTNPQSYPVPPLFQRGPTFVARSRWARTRPTTKSMRSAIDAGRL